jgi:hypothetical protein
MGLALKHKPRVGLHMAFEEVQFDGDRHFYYIEFYASGEVTDCGIGSYEFWGAKGYDSRPCVEEFSIDLEVIEAFDPITEDRFSIPLSGDSAKRIEEYLYEDRTEYILDKLEEEMHEEPDAPERDDYDE